MSSENFRILPLSNYYGLSNDDFIKLGILNPTVTFDTNLFIDPMLLKNSSFDLFRNEGDRLYKKYFSDLSDKIIALNELPDCVLKEKAFSNIVETIASREINGLCLGYSRNGNQGRGIGIEKAKDILKSGIEMVEKGLKNPNMFSIVFLLNDGIGADLISDMTARIVMPVLCEFTENMSKTLGIKTNKYPVKGKIYNLPKHPLEKGYILLLPIDILSQLPIESDFDEVLESFVNSSFNSNNSIRMRVNEHIADILRDKGRYAEKKKKIRDFIISDSDAISVFGEYVEKMDIKGFDPSLDLDGILIPTKIDEYLSFPDRKVNFKSNLEIVDTIIKEFQNCISNNDDIKKGLLWIKGRARREKAWQRTFELFADRYLASYDLDLTPEFSTGSGPVDFKVSKGSKFKVLIELKLSDNKRYLHGLSNQLEIYKKSTGKIEKSYYVFINIESDETKSNLQHQHILDVKRNLGLDTELVFIDGLIHESASLRNL